MYRISKVEARQSQFARTRYAIISGLKKICDPAPGGATREKDLISRRVQCRKLCTMRADRVYQSDMKYELRYGHIQYVL